MVAGEWNISFITCNKNVLFTFVLFIGIIPLTFTIRRYEDLTLQVRLGDRNEKVFCNQSASLIAMFNTTLYKNTQDIDNDE